MSETTAPRHPALDLLARYRAIFQAAWQARHELAGPNRLGDEAAFLPAALALQETPAHPAPRRAAIAICALFAIALLWSVFGQIDIVAVAQGRIVVSERTKTLQPLETSVVSRVLVKDGYSVKAGQVLIELDATAAKADQTSVAEQLKAADSELQRTAALLDALSTRRAPRPTPLDAAQLSAEWQDIAARLAKLDAERVRREAEAATVGEAIAKLEATIPLARQREADVKGLAEQGFMNHHAGQDRARERIELERDLALQRARRLEAQAALDESRHNRAAFVAETQRSLRDRQAQAKLKREQLTQERSKTEQRSRLTRLTAPVDGVVQQLAVHTAGGVVTPAQVLMVIVPQDAEVTAEVVVDNKDIGFVQPGQRAEVKLETFPFTRYGTVAATVQRVSADAVADEKRGAIFPATLTLARGALDVNGQRVALAPGMNLTAEVKTGRRRVIDYLISPVHRAADESLRER
ncbi:MAG TPA: HlyD family type I secretion periplasmic adaptor subunit [Burkholderiaceae bacterium]|nr:HlyD family type I secretion periplasmic adaptor subunit [Burkholderiaceae bacterium]